MILAILLVVTDFHHGLLSCKHQHGPALHALYRWIAVQRLKRFRTTARGERWQLRNRQLEKGPSGGGFKPPGSERWIALYRGSCGNDENIRTLGETGSPQIQT